MDRAPNQAAARPDSPSAPSAPERRYPVQVRFTFVRLPRARPAGA